MASVGDSGSSKPQMRLGDLYTRLIGPEFDARDDTLPKRKLLICTTPRTGGHFVCQRIKQMGLGVPTEYFQWQYALPLMRRWADRADLDLDELRARAPEYGRLLLTHRSRNGVFSAKIFPENLRFMRDALGNDDGWSYLRVVRRNRVAQTVSLLAMTHTGRPFDSDDQMPSIAMPDRIGEQSVRTAVQYIHEAESIWDGLLARVGKERRACVFLEDLTGSRQGALDEAIGNLLPHFANPSSRTPQGRRYETDAELKDRIRERYGDLIAELWSKLRPVDA